MKYAFNVVVAALKARLQSAGLFYDRKFDCAPPDTLPYVPKFTYHQSPYAGVRTYSPRRARARHRMRGRLHGRLSDEAEAVPRWMASIRLPLTTDAGLSAFYLHDLNAGLPALRFEQYDYVLMLDVIEHLAKPELFLEQLRSALSLKPSVDVFLSTANIGYLVTRFMLLIGQFNYGKRGILDLTHTRLFTFGSFERAVKQAGFDIVERVGVPGPIPLALGDNFLSRALMKINQVLIHISRGLFSYQMFLRVRPQPSLELLLRTAVEHSKKRVEALETVGNTAAR